MAKQGLLFCTSVSITYVITIRTLYYIISPDYPGKLGKGVENLDLAFCGSHVTICGQIDDDLGSDSD